MESHLVSIVIKIVLHTVIVLPHPFPLIPVLRWFFRAEMVRNKITKKKKRKEKRKINENNEKQKALVTDQVE